ncbi:MAG: hypothetical protein JW730_00005 [Anaerolineales bacterium]|nr:hypothetical protein [Anaerolineales bacterium]
MSAKPIVLNGKAYRSMEEMPPDIRENYELAMCLLGNPEEEFIPSKFKTRNTLADETANTSTSLEAETLPRPAPTPVSPATTPDTSKGWMLVLAGLFILLLCATGAAVIWSFFLR